MADPGPCGMGCGGFTTGAYVWAWGEGDHRVERTVCADCVGRGRPEHPPILDATPTLPNARQLARELKRELSPGYIGAENDWGLADPLYALATRLVDALDGREEHKDGD